MLFPSFFNASAGGYEIEQSLRFDGSSYLSWANSLSDDNTARDLWTLSVWIKRGTLSDAQQGIFSAYENENNRHRITFQSDDTLQAEERGAGASKEESTTNELFRDPSAWYHLTFLYDVNAPGGSGDYIQFWINGVRSDETNAARVDDWAGVVGGSGITMNIGRVLVATPTSYFKGYLAEFHLCAGHRKAATDFGKYDDNGVWRPIEYTGSYGAHGFYLKFDPTATNGIGHDHSGNGNHWSPTGFTADDTMSDTPTTNFCTFNPLNRDITRSTPTDGNLNMPMPGRCAGTIAVNSGKWYWEAQYNAGNGYALGIGVADVDAYYPSEGFSNGIIYYGSTPGDNAGAGIYNFGTTDFSYDNAWSGGRIGIALDLDSSPQTITFYRDGTNKGAVNIPSNKNGKYFTPIVQGGSASTSGSWDLRMQSDLWTDSAPADHKELCTSNLPAPTVKDGSKYFDTVLYTGNGSTQSITGVGFQPDWVWTKKRNGAQDHFLYDVVRGSTNGNFYELRSSSQSAEGVPSTASSGLTSLDSDGFSIGSDGSVNTNNDTYVAWNWDAGGSGSSNTDGSITSTVSANPSAGFSIVTWTGSQADGTVGHSLGVAPSLIIFKRRNATTSWPVYHSTISPSNFVALNETSSSSSSGTLFGSTPTAPTSTVFSVGNNGGTNYGTMVAYCFAEVEGYSKFGSYTGNGSTDGPFIFTGFTPAFILVKWYANVNTAESWQIYDTKRLTYNPNDAVLYPDSTTAEENPADRDVDILSNGFKWRAGGQQMNRSGASYIFAAFAEHPTGGSGVSPATAR